MDSQNLADMHVMSPQGFEGTIRLLLEYSKSDRYADVNDVPDPYYGGEDGFPFVLDLIEDASGGLLDSIIAELN
jgi:protein-tyrosine phosphatase